jgi:hypothetical protein
VKYLNEIYGNPRGWKRRRGDIPRDVASDVARLSVQKTIT